MAGHIVHTTNLFQRYVASTVTCPCETIQCPLEFFSGVLNILVVLVAVHVRLDIFDQRVLGVSRTEDQLSFMNI